MPEVEAVIKSRFLTAETVSGSNSLIPVAQSNMLAMKTSVCKPRFAFKSGFNLPAKILATSKEMNWGNKSAS